MSMHDLDTLVEVLNKLKEEGFDKDFEFRNHTLKVIGSSKPYKPSEIELLEEYRFEGETDPSDASILYSLQTNDGKRGTIVDSYGATANAELHKFLDESTKYSD